MIVITHSFAGILNDWLSSHGISATIDSNNRMGRTSPLSLTRWTEEVNTAVAHIPGPARGLEIGTHVKLSHTGPLGYLVVNSRTLGEVFDTYLLLEKWFYGRNWALATSHEKHFEITWDQRMGIPDRLVEQLHAIAFLTIMRTACPTVGNLVSVEVMNSESGEGCLYAKAFGCPVQFDSPALRLTFPLSALQTPVDLDNGFTSKIRKNHHLSLREANPDASRFVRAVQEEILHCLPTGASVDSVAAGLLLSRRTLQRRLRTAGCTYRQLLDGIRERHTYYLLKDRQINLREITFLLGYSEQSAFNHAYRRWNNTSPLGTKH